MHRLVLTTLLLALAACQIDGEVATTNPESSAAAETILVEGFAPNLAADKLFAQCDEVLKQANLAFQALENDTRTATLESVFGAYDQINSRIQTVVHTFHLKVVHPQEDIRDAATACSLKISDFITMTGLSRRYYDRLAAIDQTHLEPKAAFMIDKIKRRYELAGVNKDHTTRAKIRSLQQEISEIGNTFAKNIREDVRYVETTIESLAGLPQDYLASHPADATGVVKISTDYPDLYPVLNYAHNDELRQRLRIAARSRAYPENEAVLQQLLAKRHELARLLGFETYAALSTADKMVGNPTQVASFLASIRQALDEPLARERATFLKRLQEIDPEADTVQVWQSLYLTNLLRQEDYALDSKLVRTYFSYARVRDGIFGLAEDLFGVTIEAWDTETWHEDVETFQIMENGQLLGRFYMDNHPRPDKHKHNTHWTIRSGVKGKQIPLSALAQNFPTGLMEHSQVETFLHEFGHLLHNMFAGTQPYPAIAGMSMERDFVEAPSQMLEEWIWDYDTLQTFALNERGETIPKELVEKMNRARNFGKASTTATQIYYARLSLAYYSHAPESFDLYSRMLELSAEYSPYPYVAGTHFYANFGHLNGYSSNYYMYQWSLAIATDLFSRFKTDGLRNRQTAAVYRRQVLGAAGSKPAAEFVADFLGREFSADTYRDWLRSL